MQNLKFYDRFHKKTSIQTKIINENNFTYYYALKTLYSHTTEKKLKILDYGCGSGTLDYYFAAKGHEVVGVDLSETVIALNKKSAKLMGLEKKCKFYSTRKFINNINKNTFDLVICSEVIEHVENDKFLLTLMHKFLIKGGLLYLSTPSVNAPLYRFGLLKHFDRKVGHIRRYELNMLIKLISSSGYNIISEEKIEGIIRNALFTLPPLGFLIKIIKGPLVKLTIAIDSITIKLLSESNLIILAQKI